ncbi:hypothetical protein [Okeania sp. SIO3B5]|uniref:hypothetical protein n=1 Tax=Okeania sp. SIO3B5 TaxID=2607811 RepID=UPI0025F7E81A|nr:hypothetical protein [Okeania sp. SIO3B5]
MKKLDIVLFVNVLKKEGGRRKKEEGRRSAIDVGWVERSVSGAYLKDKPNITLYDFSMKLH